MSDQPSSATLDAGSGLTVLVVVDGSDAGERAVGRVPSVVPAAAHWEVAVVIANPPDRRTGATGFASPVMTPAEADDVATADRVAGEAAAAGGARALGPVPVTQTVLTGGDAEMVADHAVKIGADVIVAAVPTGRLTGLITTSMAGDLLECARTPVLLMPLDDE